MSKAKVLIVEDERITAKAIKDSLEDLGYDVSATVASGAEALNQVKENRHDLVLMDIMLQGEMDGIETASYIGSQFDIPVVYLTAYAEYDVLERAKITEPFGYILLSRLKIESSAPPLQWLSTNTKWRGN